MVDRRRQAFEAGFQNPLLGDIGPLQRVYGTVQALGEELGGADMGTPLGRRFTERQKATKADIKRLQKLREEFPEEFGRGMMMAQEQQDPYNLGLLSGTMGAMRPAASVFSPIQGEMPVRELPAPAMRSLPPPPVRPFYRNVPEEMGTSMRPMTPFQQNQIGLSTGRFGAEGYAPEMAVTDFETYGGGMGRTSPESWNRPISGFDRNMLNAFRVGRAGSGERPSPMGGDFTLEEMGQAVGPYRQNGLVYEPVGPAQGQIGYQGSPQIGYTRGPIEGEWYDVQGIPGPRGQAIGGPVPYGGEMDFGVTRGGMATSPTGMQFDPRIAAGAAGLGYLAGLPNDQKVDMTAAREPMRRAMLPPIDVFGPRAATALSGQAPGAGTAFASPQATSKTQPQRKDMRATSKPKQGKSEAKAEKRSQAAFEPNFNYLVTRAIDELLGQREAERGREYQEYYATNPWPY